MKIGVLTSSRADYGIYLPLLKKLKVDTLFDLKIIAFGTHLSSFHGETIEQIESDGFEVKYKVESMLINDSPEAIATAVGLTTIKFADFWQKNKTEFDLVFCLGDRYEMFAAVTASIPFGVTLAHLHGGETTLGAIDNIYRHAITLASKYHFVSTESYAKRVEQIIEFDSHIYNVGALSLDNLTDMRRLNIDEFKLKWGIDLSIKTILVTFHPETVALDKNEKYANELIDAIEMLLDQYQMLITMPNADTAGNIIRNVLVKRLSKQNKVFMIENLGSQSYFSAMDHCAFLLGNTSSGIIEAASLGKYVINVGDRQKGRKTGQNVIHCEVEATQILAAVHRIQELPVLYPKDNIYFKEGAASRIIDVLKSKLQTI